MAVIGITLKEMTKMGRRSLLESFSLSISVALSPMDFKTDGIECLRFSHRFFWNTLFRSYSFLP